jgi:hypothetical protein
MVSLYLLSDRVLAVGWPAVLRPRDADFEHLLTYNIQIDPAHDRPRLPPFLFGL